MGVTSLISIFFTTFTIFQLFQKCTCKILYQLNYNENGCTNSTFRVSSYISYAENQCYPGSGGAYSRMVNCTKSSTFVYMYTYFDTTCSSGSGFSLPEFKCRNFETYSYNNFCVEDKAELDSALGYVIDETKYFQYIFHKQTTDCSNYPFNRRHKQPLNSCVKNTGYSSDKYQGDVYTKIQCDSSGENFIKTYYHDNDCINPTGDVFAGQTGCFEYSALTDPIGEIFSDFRQPANRISINCAGDGSLDDSGVNTQIGLMVIFLFYFLIF